MNRAALAMIMASAMSGSATRKLSEDEVKLTREGIDRLVADLAQIEERQTEMSELAKTGAPIMRALYRKRIIKLRQMAGDLRHLIIGYENRIS